MTKRANLFLLLVLGCVLTGCSTYNIMRSVAPDEPSLRVAAGEYTSKLDIRIRLPAGDYRPVFATKYGIFYLAPSPVSIPLPWLKGQLRTGLYLPNAESKEPRICAWVEIEKGDFVGGLQSSGVDSVYNYPLVEPVVYSAIPAGSSKPSLPDERAAWSDTRLTHIDLFFEEDRTTILALNVALIKNHFVPAEYFASLEYKRDGLIRISLRHESHGPQYEGWHGDGCGKCMIVFFDSRAGEIKKIQYIR